MCETKELMNFSSIILETFKQDLIKNAKQNLTPGVVKDLKRCIASVLIDKPYDQVTEEEIKIATGE
jgi:hypothetical protein